MASGYRRGHGHRIEPPACPPARPPARLPARLSACPPVRLSACPPPSSTRFRRLYQRLPGRLSSRCCADRTRPHSPRTGEPPNPPALHSGPPSFLPRDHIPELPEPSPMNLSPRAHHKAAAPPAPSRRPPRCAPTRLLAILALASLPLVAVLGGDGLRAALDFTTGVLALVALTASVAWGLLATDRLLLRPRHRLVAQGVHWVTAIASLCFLLLHLTVKVVLGHTTLLAALVPFSGGSSATAVLAGFGSLDGLLMPRPPPRVPCARLHPRSGRPCPGWRLWAPHHRRAAPPRPRPARSTPSGGCGERRETGGRLDAVPRARPVRRRRSRADSHGPRRLSRLRRHPGSPPLARPGPSRGAPVPRARPPPGAVPHRKRCHHAPQVPGAGPRLTTRTTRPDMSKRRPVRWTGRLFHCGAKEN